MRLPDATNQMRLAPIRALRAVFSGVGQLTLAADRLREEDARLEAEESGEEQHDMLAAWDGRLSTSVRLITPAEPTGGEPPVQASQPGEPTPAKAPPAEPARADRPGKPTRPATRGGKKPADVKRAATATTGNTRKSRNTSRDRKSRNASSTSGTSSSSASRSGGTGNGRKSARSKNVAEPTRFRSLDLTGNVRMLTDEDAADLAVDRTGHGLTDAQALWPPARTQEPQSAGLTAATAAPSWSEAVPSWSSWSTSAATETPEVQPPATELAPAAPAPAVAAPAPAAPAPAMPAASDLPISGYDGLSLASLRARLRNLDPAELANLLAHERSHANREDVVTMFERRIIKLEEAEAAG